MKYQRHVRAERLRDVVEHYWSVQAPARGLIRAVLVPNGRATLQFCLATPGVRIDVAETRARNADVLLPGASAPLVLEQDGPSHYVGIQFTPWGARQLWPGSGSHPLQAADLAETLPDRRALASDPAPELDHWLTGFLSPSAQVLDILRRAVRLVDDEPSRISVSDLPWRWRRPPPPCTGTSPITSD